MGGRELLEWALVEMRDIIEIAIAIGIGWARGRGSSFVYEFVKGMDLH